MSIQIQSLTKKYGEQVAVDNISLSAKPGEIVGFLGPNGAGKSSTMKMITGFLQRDAGQILVCGQPVQENETTTRQKIGYLPEANPLYLDMYVREYLLFIASVHKIKNAKQAVATVIETVGLQQEASKKIGQLSKGYKQRVGLAAAIIHNPEVLILDEPTSGLDPNQIVEIRNVIKQLGKTKTVLLSSHIMQEVEAICDRVIIINKGKIVADDTLQNLRNTNNKTAVVTVEFNKPVAVEKLEKMPGVTSVQKKGNTYDIFSEQPDQLNNSLLRFAVEEKLEIEKMVRGSGNFEDIFRQYTNV